MDKKTLSRFLIPVIVGALIWFSPIPNGVSPDAWHILAMMTAIIVGFIAVPVNIGCVAFIGLMAVMLTGTLSPGAALKGFSNTLLWLIVTAFLFFQSLCKNRTRRTDFSLDSQQNRRQFPEGRLWSNNIRLFACCRNSVRNGSCRRCYLSDSSLDLLCSRQ